MTLKGKTALVTGSTSGIGLGVALQLARQGANIVLNGFGDPEPAQTQLKALAVEVGYHGADMSKPAEIEALGFAAKSLEHRQRLAEGRRASCNSSLSLDRCARCAAPSTKKPWAFISSTVLCRRRSIHGR